MLRLMTAPNTAHLKFGPEDSEARRFAARLRIWTMEGHVRGVWTHVPNEMAGESGSGHADPEVRKSLRRKAQIRYAVAQALGLIIGWSDYVFARKDGSLALECKSAKGGQRSGQEDFQRWCEDEGIPYRIFRTAEEGWDILVAEGVLSPAAWKGTTNPADHGVPSA